MWLTWSFQYSRSTHESTRHLAKGIITFYAVFVLPMFVLECYSRKVQHHNWPGIQEASFGVNLSAWILATLFLWLGYIFTLAGWLQYDRPWSRSRFSCCFNPFAFCCLSSRGDGGDDDHLPAPSHEEAMQNCYRVPSFGQDIEYERRLPLSRFSPEGIAILQRYRLLSVSDFRPVLEHVGRNGEPLDRFLIERFGFGVSDSLRIVDFLEHSGKF
eukprot:NODE_4091_length_863_cov_35.470516_g3775_i0.p1 GENE.NODE_4091_length_863_cov_35.470516_g3775_i0~~NODE_4091_length_863_cov_35.470516_g3775_i0.p1  ORF type:complete len:242 (+),score=39.05 NODE_4091_length_863_cov_35.470516_g3775_i0:85-726(+)